MTTYLSGFYHLSSSSVILPWALGRSHVGEVSTGAECPPVSCTLHLDQGWISVYFALLSSQSLCDCQVVLCLRCPIVEGSEWWQSVYQVQRNCVLVSFCVTDKTLDGDDMQLFTRKALSADIRHLHLCNFIYFLTNAYGCCQPCFICYFILK